MCKLRINDLITNYLNLISYCPGIDICHIAR